MASQNKIGEDIFSLNAFKGSVLVPVDVDNNLGDSFYVVVSMEALNFKVGYKLFIFIYFCAAFLKLDFIGSTK